jgi:cytochrome c oxidase subunit IV
MPEALWRAARAPLLAWLGLCLLLALTCGLAYVPLGRGNLPASLCIAGLKALLVGSVFMRLGEPNPLNRLAACAGFVWLFVMFLLIGSDYMTR